MAAGLGFKDFVTGEVLTAADVDGYLMQGVWVFASAAARDAAVTSPQEGNFAYLKDTNVTTYYTGSAWANLDTTGMTNPMTTTGDTIYSSSGSTPARLGIGSTGQVLTVAGGVPSWATPAAGGSFPAFSASKQTSTQTITASTFTKITFTNELFDTAGNFASSTFTPTTAGYYQVGAIINIDPSSSAYVQVALYKNGTRYQFLSGLFASADESYIGGSVVVAMNGTTDYLEIYARAGANADVFAGADVSNFNGVGIRGL